MKNSIHVIDYKHGKGVAVEITNNGQLMQYALGELIKQADRDIDVKMTIVQPRAFHPDGPIRSIEVKGRDLIKWGKSVLVPAAKATLKSDAPLVPNDAQCRWCPAKAHCSALYKKTQEVAILDFEDEMELPDPRLMTDDQMMIVMEYGDVIKKFIDAVSLESKLRMDSGDNAFDEKFKLVKSRTSRKLIDNAIDELDFYIDENQLYTKKLKGIGDIEKLLKSDYTKTEIQEILKEVTTKAEGVTVIAPISDKRKAISSSVISDFDDLIDDEL